MGYGHERAAYGLRDLAYGNIITANAYPGIPVKEKKLWENTRRMYEAVSRVKSIPIIGETIFGIMDKSQRIAPFYPRRDLSTPSLQTLQTYYFIEKLGMCKHLIELLSKKPKPLICTFFTAAFAAEVYNYPGEIFLQICDADMARVWAPRDPKKSRIKYFAPNGRVVERLKLYGVREENIYLTGFPLPKELIGGPDADTIKKDLLTRLCNLDPNGIFLNKYQKTIAAELGMATCNPSSHRPLTLSFAIGGAGAQENLGLDVLRSLKLLILKNTLCLRLVAGTKKDLAQKFIKTITEFGLKSRLGKNLFVDYFPDRHSYFIEFSKILRHTDILWTKPSEMSFYCGVGLPIIMAPSIGSQEVFNRRWLKMVGAGVTQDNPHFTNEWLCDWISSGGLARLAWNGYMEAPTHGSYRIESIITGEEIKLEKLPLII